MRQTFPIRCVTTAVKQLRKLHIKRNAVFVLTNVGGTGGTAKVRRPAGKPITVKSVLTVKRSLHFMGMRKGHTAAERVTRKLDKKRGRTNRQKPSAKNFLAERNYRICLQVVSALIANGLLTKREAVRVRKRLKKKYDPIIGRAMLCCRRNSRLIS